MIKILWLHFYFSGCWHFATNRFRTSAKNWYLCERRCKWYKGLKRLLKIIVKTEMFKGADIPEPSNKCFFPRTSTIRNHTTHTKRKLCPMIDQDCLQEKIKQCKLSDKSSNIFFRPKTFFSLRWNCWKEFEDDIDIEKHDSIRLGKTETTPFLLFIKMGGKRDCLPDMVTSWHC